MRAKPQSFLRHSELGCQHSLNMQIQTSRSTLEPILGPNPQSLLLEMEEKFPTINPHPKEELASIMYKAGQRSVVEWYKNRLDD